VTQKYRSKRLEQIAYWRYGLDVAREWKKKLGQPIPESWTVVAENLAPPPQVDGLYTVYEGLNSSWWEDASLIGDPRSMIMLQGILPDTPAVDPSVALKTADKIWEIWGDSSISGWGRPVLAINSARIGNPERAIYHMTAFDYWTFDDAGEFCKDHIKEDVLLNRANRICCPGRRWWDTPTLYFRERCFPIRW
jgi:hypothetical protein